MEISSRPFFQELPATKLVLILKNRTSTFKPAPAQTSIQLSSIMPPPFRLHRVIPPPFRTDREVVARRDAREAEVTEWVREYAARPVHNEPELVLTAPPPYSPASASSACNCRTRPTSPSPPTSNSPSPRSTSTPKSVAVIFRANVPQPLPTGSARCATPTTSQQNAIRHECPRVAPIESAGFHAAVVPRSRIIWIVGHAIRYLRTLVLRGHDGEITR